MPTPVAWFMFGLVLCLGVAMLVMALRTRFRPGYGRGLRPGMFFMGGSGVCEAISSLLLTGDFGLPHALALGIAVVSVSLGLAMALVAALSTPLGLGIPLDLPIPLRWYALLLPTAAQSTRHREQGQDER